MNDSQQILRAALEHAVQAPSGHNTQPWRFRMVDDHLELYADRTRSLPVVDPDDRALIISCGAAAAFLRVALRHLGHAGDVVALPDPTHADLLAVIGAGNLRTPDERDHQRFQAIGRRHTHRSAFESSAVPPEVLTALRADADRFGATLRVILDQATKDDVAALVAEGDRTQMSDPRFRRELASWVRSNYSRRGDGIPGYAIGIPGLPSLVGPWLMRSIDLGEKQSAKDAELTATAPALLLLTTPNDSKAHWLAAGQALGTLLLTATAAGLAASFLNQPIETSDLRGSLAERLDTTDARPQLLLRLGYPSTPDRPTPRRPVTEVLTPRQA
jgi:nitroreductase